MELAVDANHSCMAPLRPEVWDSLDLGYRSQEYSH
jgi:hypothetical protein